jgi:hypothetical protein
MFDTMDNIPQEWPARRRGGRRLAERISFQTARRRLVQFAKFAVVEALNSTKDYEEIVDEWLDQSSHCPSPLPVGEGVVDESKFLLPQFKRERESES